MSEDTTRDMSSRSFEERVFARFDSLDARIVETLENQAQRRALETKPIWERALAEIGEVKIELGEVRGEVGQMKVELGEVRSEVGQMKGELGEVRSEVGQMKGELGEVKTRLGAVEDRLGALADLTKPLLRKVDILTRDVSTVRAEQLGLEDRIEKLEPNNV